MAAVARAAAAHGALPDPQGVQAAQRGHVLAGGGVEVSECALPVKPQARRPKGFAGLSAWIKEAATPSARRPLNASTAQSPPLLLPKAVAHNGNLADSLMPRKYEGRK